MRTSAVVVALLAVLVAAIGQPVLAQEGEGATGAVSGTVQEEVAVLPLQPLEGVCVTAYELFLTFVPAATATTAQDGTYTLEGLAPGEYFVAFNQCEEPLAGYAAEWWEDAPGFVEAQPVTVEAGETRDGIDAVLGEAGTLSGAVTDANGEPLSGICVQVVESQILAFALTATDDTGGYELPNLQEGDYLVVFVDCSDPLTSVAEFYDDVQPFDRSDSQQDATEVNVAAGEETDGIDAALDEGGLIVGTVTAAHTRREVPLTCVSLHDATVDSVGESLVTATLSGFDTSMIMRRDGAPERLTGEYHFGGVPAGSYQVGFETSCGDDGYRPRWYEGSSRRSQARTIEIQPGTVVEGVTGVLHPAPSISWACGFGQQVVVTGSDGSQEQRNSGFDDVSNDNVHQPAIDCVAEYGIAQGDENGDYHPDEPVRRDQMASFAARTLATLGVDLPRDPADAFSDDDGNTHETAINQLAELGIVSGTGDGRYSPGRDVRRGEMTAFLVAAYEKATDLTLNVTGDHFDDDEATTFERTIDLAAAAGIAAGTSGSSYEPGKRVLRDQMASFLARTLDRAFRDVFYERGFFGGPSQSGSVSEEGSSQAEPATTDGLLGCSAASGSHRLPVGLKPLLCN